MSTHSAIMTCMHCFLVLCNFQSIHPRIRGSQKYTTKKDAFKTGGLDIQSPGEGLQKIESTECHSNALHSVVSAQGANHNNNNNNNDNNNNNNNNNNNKHASTQRML